MIRATQGRARLFLTFQDMPDERRSPFAAFASFQVQFNNKIYGTLAIAPDPENPAMPALPLPVAQLLAHLCGLLLSTLELSIFIGRQSQRLEHQDPAQLTRREREVLELICRGYDQQAIAETLDITPATVDTHRKRISGKLGVHRESDIPLAAYQSGLCSLLKES